LREVLETLGPENVTVIGNSAGAGLALAATQWLRDGGFSRPKGLVLISPALDATMDYSEQAAIAANDVMQDIPGLAEAMRLYAGGLDIAHPFVSPLNGNLHDLPAMTVFTSTFDLFYPDSVALSHKAARAGVPIEMYVRSGLPHNYALLPTPEGREARDIIARLVAE
jgi:acetyl esterase/lipase